MFKNKRFAMFCALLIALTFCFSTVSFAEEIQAAEDVPIVETASEDAPLQEDSPGAENSGASESVIYVDVFNRVWEYVQTYLNEILSALGFLGIAVFGFYQKMKNNSFVLGFKTVLSGQKNVVTSSDSSAQAVKEMAEKQDKLILAYEEHAKNENTVNKVSAALLCEVMSLIEIQYVTVLNNANVPQSIKNLVTSKYARCISVINDDAELKAAYDEMREILGVQKTEEVNGNEEKTA